MRIRFIVPRTAILASALLLAGCELPPDDGYYGGGYGGGYYGGSYLYEGYGSRPPGGDYVARYDLYPGGGTRYPAQPEPGLHDSYRDTYSERAYPRFDRWDPERENRDFRQVRPETQQGDLGQRMQRDRQDYIRDQSRDAYNQMQDRREQGPYDPTQGIAPKDPRAGIYQQDFQFQQRSSQNEREAQRRTAPIRRQLAQEQAARRKAEESQHQQDLRDRESLPLYPTPGQEAQQQK
jgi:hypothetical protein